MPTHLKILWERAALTGQEDFAVTTHDFAPEVGEGAASHARIRARFSTFWTAIRALFPDQTRPFEFRFYDGYDGDGSPGEVDEVLGALAYGISTSPAMPPQCSITVTEVIPQRRSWGRFYLPAPSSGLLADDGRIVDGFVTQIADAAKVMYDGWYTDTDDPIVWRDALGTPVIAPVEEIRVDNIVDIIRRRRWESTSFRAIRDLATD